MENEKVEAEVAVGDFVEAVFVADPSIIRRGVVVKIFGPRSVVVKGWEFESLCENPRKIPDSKLTAKDLDLASFIRG